MMFKVPEKNRVKQGFMKSDESYGNNGQFIVRVNGEDFLTQASDGMGWEHVSVSRLDGSYRTPSWEDMCEIKSIFWDDEDTVVQFHPAKSQYVNFMVNCLHLWRCTSENQISPPSFLVGPKVKSNE